MKLKLKKIQKLDILRKDLDKLKYLSELPEMFKNALDIYAQSKSAQKPQPTGLSGQSEESQTVNLSDIFGKPLSLYYEYSDILVIYKKTKFMQDLYNDIKSQVSKVKVILQNELEKIKTQDVTF